MPVSADRLIRYERLVAPREQLGVLVEPAPARLRAALIKHPPPRPESIAVLDTTLAALRAQLRQQLGLDGPVILTGHQPEFVHAGVFAKTVAIHTLARQLGGQAAYLLVDSDHPRTAQLALPQITSGGLRRIEVLIPDCDPKLPFEAQPNTPREHWLQFFARFASMYELYDRSLLREFAYAWLTTEDRNPSYCDAMSRGRAAAEHALGLDGIRELRISALSATPAFRAFAACLLLDAGRCAAQYNAAQTAFRERHRLRAAGRPVPPLKTAGEHVESPFWVYRRGTPRHRLFVTARGDSLELFADRTPFATLPRAALARAKTHDEPWPIENDGWLLRPRALLLSAFARLFVADLFIHGIGGARYDEMMEDFIRRLFGVAPWPAACVSATLHLPLPHHDVQPGDIAAARHQSRDIRYNPQRHLRDLPAELVRQRAKLVRRSAELRKHEPRERTARRVVFREIRRINEQMLGTDPWRAAEYDRRVDALQRQRELDRIALDREYFYALHPRQALYDLVQTIQTHLSAD